MKKLNNEKLNELRKIEEEKKHKELMSERKEVKCKNCIYRQNFMLFGYCKVRDEVVSYAEIIDKFMTSVPLEVIYGSTCEYFENKWTDEEIK